MSVKELQEYTFKSKYAAWIPEKKRREIWSETVDRYCDMFLEKYKDKPKVFKYIERIRKAIKKKKVLGSQRGLQFGGPPVLKRNARIFNCCFSYVDRVDFFKECMFLLMCGCGTGFSVQFEHINKLPNIKSPIGRRTFIVPDSVEGWSDAIGAIASSYFEGYDNRHIDFDYSLISPKGTRLNSCSGKAPGPYPLKKAIEFIRKLFDVAISSGQSKLKPIEVYDIIMHFSDAVISGGVRRSATICLFSKTDMEMRLAKTGNWFNENPQRGRSNNSVVLIKNETSLEEFEEIMESVKQFGEPGFVWADSIEHGVNPCQPNWSTVLTKDGIREFKDINVGSEIWSEDGWVKVIKKWSTGNNEVYKYRTTFGSFYGTAGHKLVTSSGKIEADYSEDIQILTGEYKATNISPSSLIKLEPLFIMDGLLIGDGSVHKASNNLVHLYIGNDDQDYFKSEISHLIKKYRPGISEKAYEVINNIVNYYDLPDTYERRIPIYYLYNQDRNTKFLFLRGLYSANGSVCNNRVTLKSSSPKLIEDVQCMLSSLGIRSYITTNKPKIVKFSNGEYECKESYDLNITTDRDKFVESIGFIQNYKNEKISLVDSKSKSEFSSILSKEFISIEETFDITVDGPSHTYWTNGCNVSNCCEISFWAYCLKTGLSGWQGCNLSTINAGKVTSEFDFYRSCYFAAIIGTLQAGFTNLGYLGEVSESIFRQEALLGVSMTGILENSDICLNEEIQCRAAQIIKLTNAKIADIIGINHAARTTCVKPEGTASCILGTSSGIHPHHAKRYIRRVQANKSEDVYQHFHKFNKIACEESVWSANDTDDVISFPIEVPDGFKLKNQLSAIDMLKIVQKTQNNWVTYGRNIKLCTQPWLNHNVSNTITVQPNEWKDVTQHIYDNRHDYCGISLLPSSGDKEYPQAPFVEIFLSSELVKTYGEAALYASGVIVQAKELFDDNLWEACDALMGIIKVKGVAKKGWITKATKYAIRYLDGDIKKLTYCLKDVDNLKLYTDLKRDYIPVDYNDLIEEENNVVVENDLACSGGKCMS